MITIFIYHGMYMLLENLSSYEEMERKRVFHYRLELKVYLTNSHRLSAGKCFIRRHRNRPTYLWIQISITERVNLCLIGTNIAKNNKTTRGRHLICRKTLYVSLFRFLNQQPVIKNHHVDSIAQLTIKFRHDKTNWSLFMPDEATVGQFSRSTNHMPVLVI